MNGCLIALQQGRYTYQHDQVLLSLLVDIGEYCDDAIVFARLDNYRAGNTPLATIPPSILTASYRPDIVIFNAERHDIRLLELTCLFNSAERLQAAWVRKSSKMKNQLLLSGLYRLGFACQYVTVGIGCLGHYLPEIIRALQKTIQQSAAACHAILDKAGQKAIDSSQIIFPAHDCVYRLERLIVNFVLFLFVYVFCSVLYCLSHVFLNFFFTFLAMPILCIFVLLCSHMCPR